MRSMRAMTSRITRFGDSGTDAFGARSRGDADSAHPDPMALPDPPVPWRADRAFHFAAAVCALDRVLQRGRIAGEGLRESEPLLETRTPQPTGSPAAHGPRTAAAARRASARAFCVR